MLMQSEARQFERLPPHSIESEKCLLSAMMADPLVVPEVRLIVSREAFFQLDHQIIFDVICRLIDRGRQCDQTIVCEEMARAQVLQECGGVLYLAELVGHAPFASHAASYAATIRELWIKRETIAVATEIMRRAYGPASEDNSEAIAQDAASKLARLHNLHGGSGAQKLVDILIDVRQGMDSGGGSAVHTGFAALDDVIGGILPGELWLIGARPSMGKSTWIRQCAVRAARAGTPTLIISLEESKAKIGRNILSAETSIDNRRIRRPGVRGEQGSLSEAEWSKVENGINQLCGVPLWATDRSRRLQDIRAEASMMVARHGVKLVIIDYLQRVQAGGKDSYERAGNASLGVSDMLKDLGVAGIVPVQLNRGPEQRDDKRPTMRDLRDSGQIEQDADGILFLHREDYYHTDDPQYQPTGIAELIVAKNRDGSRGVTVRLKSNLRYQAFEDYEERDKFADQF